MNSHADFALQTLFRAILKRQTGENEIRFKTKKNKRGFKIEMEKKIFHGSTKITIITVKNLC